VEKEDDMRVTRWVLAAAIISVAAPAAAQNRRGPEETERFSRKVKLGDDGRFSLANIAGDVVITGGGGGEATIEAVKRTRGPRSQLATVEIEVQERAGRLEVRTRHTARNDRVSVDFNVTLPRSVSVDLTSVSGSVKIDDVRGAVRAQSVSGNVTTSRSPRVESAKSVSGNVEIAGSESEADLSVSSVSGSVVARRVKVRRLELGTVSGRVEATEITCDRLEMKSVSGDLDFSGPLARNGSYTLNSHSGGVRLVLSGSTGFELNANTFSGSIRSDVPVTLEPASARGRRRGTGSGRATRAVFGDGSADLNVTTFSGDINIQKR
jgi:DUF4097 and DUF4098 domain-containing protein YvlB